MTFKPPHSEFSKVFTNAEGTKRINRENKAARDAYNRGKNFERGRKDA